MRSFTDPHGRRWDAVLGKESYGTLVIIFTPRGGGEGEVRKAILAAQDQLAGARELDALGEEELRQRLAGSAPWG
jgi:hypothetical protein